MVMSMDITAATAGKAPLLHKSFQRILCLAAMAGWTMYSGTATAAELRLSPRISMQQLYTNNAEAGDSSGDAITTLTPGFLATAKNRRMDLSLDYSLQDNYYAERERNRLFHLADVNGRFTILRELLSLDASLQNSQQNISNSGVNGYDNLTLSADASNVLRYSIDPALQYKFGNFAGVELKYSFGGIQTDLDDSEDEKYLLALKSGAAFNRLLWDLSYTSNRQDYQSRETIILDNFTGRFRYLLGRNLALVTSGGYDSNSYSSTSDVNGPLWNAGFEWKPGPRTSLSLLYGKRYFGTDLNVQVSHRTRRAMLTLTYAIEPETTRNILTQRGVFRNTDPFGNINTGPDATIPESLALGVPGQTNEVYVQKRLDLILGYTLRMHRIYVEFSDVDRSYEFSGRNETLQEMGLSWDLQFSAKTSASLKFRRIDSLTVDPVTRIDRGEEYLITNGEIRRLIGENFNISAGFAYIIRNSAFAEFEHEEGRIYAGLSKIF